MTTDARITALIEGLLEGHPERRVDPARFGGERGYLRTLMNIQPPWAFTCRVARGARSTFVQRERGTGNHSPA